MVSREFADYELQPLSNRQIRDFGSRILYVVAQRLDIANFQCVDSMNRVRDDDQEISFNYMAELDKENETHRYDIEVCRQERLDTEWNEGVVQEIFTENYGANLGIIYVDEVGEEVDDPSDAVAISYEGNFTTRYEYIFEIPLGRYPATASKGMYYTISDDDDEILASESGYSNYMTYNAEEVLALERLWHNGEPISDFKEQEASLSRVTARDLDDILYGLKQTGLIGKRAVTLSKNAKT